jgi:hypothetical protein
MEKIDSSRLTSITWPRPPLTSTLRTAITVAMAPDRPAIMSAMARRRQHGSRSSKPLREAKPDMASTSVPKPGRFAYGPVWPKPETRTTTSRGFRSSSASGPTPSFSR